MDPSLRGALLFVRFIAGLIIGCSLLFVGLYATDCLIHQRPVEILPCVLRSLPDLVGIIIFIKARALAEWLADLLDQ